MLSQNHCANIKNVNEEPRFENPGYSALTQSLHQYSAYADHLGAIGS
jgi:hypothetical protein